MLPFLFMIGCGIALPIISSLTFWPIHEWYEFYKAIVMLIAGLAFGLGFDWIFVWLCGLPISYKKEYTKPSKWCKFWLTQGLWFINHCARIKCKVVGKEKLPTNSRFLIVTNHRSKFDSMLISEKFGYLDIAYISKQSNFKIPLGSKFMWGICYLPIDRNDKMQSLETMKKAIELLKNNATSIGVFPEGTRQQDKIVGEFHEGVFNIALKANVPIVIACTKNTDNIHKNFPLHSTKVTLEVVGVIAPDEFEGDIAKAVSDKVHSIMANYLK